MQPERKLDRILKDGCGPVTEQSSTASWPLLVRPCVLAPFLNKTSAPLAAVGWFLGMSFFLGGWYILGRKLGSLQILEGYSHQLQILNGKKRMGETLIEIWISCL